MSRLKNLIGILTTTSGAAVLGILFSEPLQARNGFLPHYVGLHGLMGGAGMAAPEDGSNVITNPAALSDLSNHLLLMAGVIHQDQFVDSSKATTFPGFGNSVGRQRNGYTNVPIGTLGFSYRLNPKITVGLGVSGGGGFVKTIEPVNRPVPTKGYNTEASNNIVLTVPAASYALDSDKSIGIGLLLGYSDFKSNLALGDGSQVAGKLDSDVALGAGARLGGLWKINSTFSIGSSISTPVFFENHGKYKQLFTTSIIPGTFLIGVAIKLSPKTTVAVDVKEIFYGNCRWLRQNQGWRNQTVYLAGVQHQITPKTKVGIGYNYGEPPMNKNFVHINSLSIPLDEHNITGGVRYKLTEKIELVGVGFYTLNKKMTDNGGGGAGIPPAIAKGATLESRAYGGEIGFKYNF